MRETLWLEENKFYHVYNRGNAGSNIFFQHRNYEYFLRKYDEYISGYAETYAFCLMPNHFHLLIRIKPYSEFPKTKTDSIPQRDGIRSPEGKESVVSEQFRKLFISYTQSINRQEERTGSLFQKNFKRKEVDNENYFTRVVYYIHRQPSHHGFAHIDDSEYPWSSYGRILSDRQTKLMKKEVLDWFGGKEPYRKFHRQPQSVKEIRHLIIE